MKVALVLGAGGVVGGAWLTGAMVALNASTGWSPVAADVVIGTSAGSVVAAFVAAGVAPRRLLPGPPEEGLDAAPDWLRDLTRPGAYRFPWRLPTLRPGSIGLARRALRERAPSRMISGLVPPGTVPTTVIETAVRRVVADGWAPHDACWIVACDYRTGDRVVFGRDDAPRPPLATAVAASCAIPGFFRPVPVAGRLYVDGGLHSMSNLDLLVGHDLDLVVALSPMSTRARPRSRNPWMGVAAALRRRRARQVAAEVARLRRDGAEVLLLEPGEADLAAMGPNVMDGSRARRVAEVARDTTLARLELPSVRHLVDRLRSAARR
ncbi:MAG TPA: patatin-like phospholipase family protein [Candidatus Dormibacteraeota bacterium]|nr:patatin-like phospholipase family protein [Candidatus Dormibacteraeota bacterium]